MQSKLVDAGQLDVLRDAHPQIDRALAVHTSRMRELFGFHLAGSFYSVRRRLARQLEFLLEFSGKGEHGEATQELALAQDMRASSICATRQAITKLLQEWGDAGIIDCRRRKLRVLDRQRLHAIASEEQV